MSTPNLSTTGTPSANPTGQGNTSTVDDSNIRMQTTTTTDNATGTPDVPSVGRKSPARPASLTKVAVILGCKVEDDGKPSDMLAERVYGAINFYAENDKDVLFICSGAKGVAVDGDAPVSEAECMRALLADMGVKPSQIILEDQATDTFENATNTLTLLRHLRRKEMTVITSDFHMSRAMQIFNAVMGSEITLHEYKADYQVNCTPKTQRWLDSEEKWKRDGPTNKAILGLKKSKALFSSADLKTFFSHISSPSIPRASRPQVQRRLGGGQRVVEQDLRRVQSDLHK